MKVKVKKVKKFPVPIAAEQEIMKNHLVFNKRDKSNFYSDEYINDMCKEYQLTRVSLNDLLDMIIENIYESEDGKKFVLAPLLWLWHYI